MATVTSLDIAMPNDLEPLWMPFTANRQFKANPRTVRAGRPSAPSTPSSNLLTRTTGDIMALSPPLIVEKKHIDEIFGTIGSVLKTLH
jgi:adenosylmethionine-8-amino-7-oxononanoate aminotransferase